MHDIDTGIFEFSIRHADEKRWCRREDWPVDCTLYPTNEKLTLIQTFGTNFVLTEGSSYLWLSSQIAPHLKLLRQGTSERGKTHTHDRRAVLTDL
jgi:hypothetical protein